MEYKHFSHVHALAHHQMPQGTEIQCSGCKFPAPGNVYACCKCSYFLHEQCFQASRSLKHPSHTSHPLTLVPYPTYPSNSFYCNTCNLIGSGFSYSCSECDFDLHVHCAFSPNPAPRPMISSHVPYPNYSSVGYGGTQSFNPQPASPLYQTAGYPYYNNQSNQNVNFHPNHYESVPHNPTLNPSTNNCPLPYSYPGSVQPDTSLNTSPSSPTSFYGSILPNSSPNPPPVTTAIPVGYPESSQHNSSANPPANNNTPASFGGSQAFNTPKYEIKPPETSPLAPQASDPVRISLLSNPSKVKGLNHFSHPHPLVLTEIKETARKVCSGCEDDLTGSSAYSCVQPGCDFNLHESCFELPEEIHHKSHLDHPLKLLAKPPPSYADGQFTCNACLQNGAAFGYNCNVCSFDLHVDCVSLPESIIRTDHRHPLKIFYSNPIPKTLQQQGATFVCDVCREPVHEIAWIYYCHECDFGTHLGCAVYEVRAAAQKTEEELVREAEIKLAMLSLLINGGDLKI